MPDYPSIYDCKILKSRSVRACSECGEPIKRGDRYEYVRGLWGGVWATYYTCLECVEVRGDGDFRHGALADTIVGWDAVSGCPHERSLAFWERYNRYKLSE